MLAYETNDLAVQQAQSKRAYHEFMRVPSISMGLYHLPAGTVDPQHPHSEDEVYYVVSGKAQIQVKEETRPVQAGSIVFVAAYEEHHFFNITEDLSVIVFFTPAEYTNQSSD
ncbi:MAG: cupin domain-containing protein [Anaerolineae bacterium]